MTARAARRLPTAPQAAPEPEQPDVQRASVSLLLDVLALGRRIGDSLDLLLLAAVVQANNAPVAGRADLQLRYAALSEPTPDDLRRPISMHAVATSLGLSFESVRRRIHGLADRGLCRLSPEGAVVPTPLLASPEFNAAGVTAYRRLQAHHAALQMLGALHDLPAPTASLHDPRPPVRAALRLLLEYLLRLSDAARAGFGDLVTCLLLFETVRANTEHLGFVAGDPQTRSVFPDEVRRPVTVADLSRRLGFAAETTRRHARALEEAGTLVRREGGLIVPAARLANPDVARFAAENLRHTRRLFSGLSSLGILERWASGSRRIVAPPEVYDSLHSVRPPFSRQALLNNPGSSAQE